jgi:hypothetical protein
MTSAMQMNDAFSQFTSKNLDALSLWAELNQTVLREFVGFSAGMATEGVRLYAEIQVAAIEALKDGWIDGTQRTFRLFGGAAQAVSRSTERVQTSAEQTARDVQAGFAHWSEALSSLYGSSPQQPPRPRAQKAEAA